MVSSTNGITIIISSPTLFFEVPFITGCWLLLVEVVGLVIGVLVVDGFVVMLELDDVVSVGGEGLILVMTMSNETLLLGQVKSMVNELFP